MAQAALDRLGDLIRFTEDSNGHSPDESLGLVNSYLGMNGPTSPVAISERAWHHYRAGERQPNRTRIRAISRYTGISPIHILDGDYTVERSGVVIREK